MKHGHALAIVLVFITALDARASAEVTADQLCPPPPEDISEGSREWQRNSICRSHLEMLAELRIDIGAWQNVIDALTDRFIEQQRRSTITDHTAAVRAHAASLSAMLSRVSAAIGDQRMEAFYTYMHTGFERMQMSALRRELAPDAALSPEQESQLMALLTQRSTTLNEMGSAEALWQPDNLREFSSDEQNAISELNQIARWQRALLAQVELDARVQDEAARFLSPVQLDALKRVNNRAHKESVRYTRRAWMALDHAQLAQLQKRIAATPRGQAQVPIDEEIDIEYSIAIDDEKPIEGRQSVANGAPIKLRSNDLLVEIKPTIYKRDAFDIGLFERPSIVEIAYFADVQDTPRKLKVPSAFGRGPERLEVVEGVRKGHLVRSTVKVSD